MSSCVVGIDVGTESVRAGVFDHAGRRLGTGVGPIRTRYPRPGWAEQSTDEWDVALARAIGAALRDSGMRSDEVAAVAADGTTSTVVTLDAKGNEVRPPLLWMDVRAHREAAQITATDDPALAPAGGAPVSAEWFPCKLLWLKRNEPRHYERTVTACELTDWLVLRLTGEIAGTVSAASMRMLYNDERGGIPRALYERVGLADALEKMPARYFPAGARVGTVCALAAERYGLRAGTPVAAGGADAPIGALGMGVVAPGRLGLVTGSSHVHFTHLERETHARGLFGSYPNGLVPGLHLLEGGQSSTGSVLRWFVDRFLPPSVHDAASRHGVSPIEEISRIAAKLPLGSEGLVVLDHFQGNRSPWADPSSRGAVRGLTLAHGPGHVARAIMESVACGASLVARTMEAAGASIGEIVLCGGVCRSELWTQMHADALGRPVSIPAEPEAPLLGSAIAAAVGAGLYPDLPTAAASMVRHERGIEPDPGTADTWAMLCRRYERTYLALARESRRSVELDS